MPPQKRKASTSAATSISNSAKAIEEKVEESPTVLWDDLPSWQQDNHFIHTGYRSASSSFYKSFASLAYTHNETVNIWSHLIGAALFTGAGILLYTLVRPRYESSSTPDITAFGCFFAGAAACLGMSGTYHTISNHSPMVAKFGNKLDYVGIVFLITGSFIPSVFYGFYCHHHLQELYWTMICSIGLGCATVSIFERFRTPAWRPYRAGMFVLMGLSAIFPIVHGLKLYGFEDMKARMGLNWMILQGFLYILGAGLYAARWPERTWPGAFDIWGSSHQIFHVLVVMAAASHLYGLSVAFDYRHSISGVKC